MRTDTWIDKSDKSVPYCLGNRFFHTWLRGLAHREGDQLSGMDAGLVAYSDRTAVAGLRLSSALPPKKLDAACAYRYTKRDFRFRQ